jgi:hypothetical protein
MWKAVRNLVVGTGLLVGAVLGAAVGFGGNVPLIPSNPTFSEPNQIINTLNTWAQSLNGQVNAITPTPANFGLGAYCSNGVVGNSPQVCNGSRGAVLFSSLTIAATGTTMTSVITNSLITAASNCTAAWNTAFTAGSGVTVATVVPTAGTLTVISVNAGSTTNAVSNGTLGFNCFN